MKICALFLAACIVNIYVTDSYCSFQKKIIKPRTACKTPAKKKSCHSHTKNESSSGHAHHYSKDNGHKHDAAHHHDAEKTNTGKENKNKKSKDGCCKDETGSFLSSLSNPVINSVSNKAFVHPSIDAQFQNNSGKFFAETYSIKPEYLLFRPPPCNTEIRVFIKSFII